MPYFTSYLLLFFYFFFLFDALLSPFRYAGHGVSLCPSNAFLLKKWQVGVMSRGPNGLRFSYYSVKYIVP